MSIPPEPPTRPEATAFVPRPRSAAMEFAEAWAVLVRTLAFYPPTNDRVLIATADAMAAFAAARAELGGEVTLLLSRREVLAGRGATPLQPGSNLVWLSERLECSGWAGVTFEPALEEQGLVEFSHLLLERFRRVQAAPGTELEAPLLPPGIGTVRQHFEGSFHGDEERCAVSWLEALVEAHPTARADPLALIAARDDQVRQRLERLLGLLGTEPAEEGPSIKSADLLNQLVHALPAEATHREADLLQSTLGVLDGMLAELERDRLQQADRDLAEALALDPVTRSMAETCRRLFARDGLPTDVLARRQLDGIEPREIAPWMRGHPHDEGVTDDVDALLAEIEGLPRCSERIFGQTDESETAEQLGVGLHYLTRLESDEEASRTYALTGALLRTRSPRTAAILDLYLQPLREEIDSPEHERHCQRMLAMLRETDLSGLLAEHGVFTDATVVDVFPQHFGTWLEGLDVFRPKGRERLLEVCAQLGADRIRAASEALQGPDGIQTPERIERILSVQGPEMGPLVRLLALRGDADTKVAVVRYLRSVTGDCEEACLLELMGVGKLPRDYLAELADPSEDEAIHAQMRTRIADLLAERVEELEDQPYTARRRLDAVHLLARFHSRHSREVLRELVGRKKLRFLGGDTELQRAAREALRRYE